MLTDYQKQKNRKAIDKWQRKLLTDPAYKDKLEQYRAWNRNYSKQYYKENKDKIANDRLKKLYGLSIEERDNLFKKQNNCCAICKTNIPGGRYNKWHIDHCHEKNIVRGILCSRCNHGIGLFKNNPIFLEEAIKYLKKE